MSKGIGPTVEEDLSPDVDHLYAKMCEDARSLPLFSLISKLTDKELDLVLLLE